MPKRYAGAVPVLAQLQRTPGRVGWGTELGSRFRDALRAAGDAGASIASWQLAVAAPTLIRFLFTDRYLDAVPIFRLALISIPMAALPLEGVMRARAQNRFMLRISVVKLLLTVPLVWAGLRVFGPIGALGGWICAEESCRLILLHRAATLFGTRLSEVLPREIWSQISAAAIASAPSAIALRMAGGPLLVQLCTAGIVFIVAYLAALRAMGVLPPVRSWIPQRKPDALLIREAA